jgi:hypothetical protein
MAVVGSTFQLRRGAGELLGPSDKIRFAMTSFMLNA